MSLPANYGSNSSSTVPQKRKGSSQVKFYAVKAGHTPGVYLSWKECEQHISGFRGAVCECSRIAQMTSTDASTVKSFATREEADAYMAGRASSSKSTQPSSQFEKFYGVAKGRNPGVYTDWATAQEQIIGWKFPKYKKFTTRTEAEEFVRSGGNANAQTTFLTSGKDLGGSSFATGGNSMEDDTLGPREAKRAKNATNHELPANFDYDMTNSFKKDIPEPTGPAETTVRNQREILRIHTDGSSLSNGRNEARAGLGVYFGPGDPR